MDGAAMYDGFAREYAACGPGLHAEVLLERGATVTGVDASARMLPRTP